MKSLFPATLRIVVTFGLFTSYFISLSTNAATLVTPQLDSTMYSGGSFIQQGTSTLPIDVPVSISYSIYATSTLHATVFKKSIQNHPLRVELWQGVPFSTHALLQDSWNFLATSTAQFLTKFPTAGSYFLISYFSDGFYEYPDSAVIVGATTTDPYPNRTNAFSGTQFTVQAPLVSTSTTGSAASNVLFIPATLTSRLYEKNPDGSERDLWEPRSDLDVGPLAMNSDGTSINPIYTRDIIDQLYSNNSLYHALAESVGTKMDVYGSFETYMNELVSSGAIKEWRAYPYDWRYDVRDIVANGTLVGSATSTSPTRIYLQDVLQQLASTSPSGKVTIIAHSNGGLLAKALAIDLQSKGELGLVDHIIMIGTPQFGTPKAITDLLHGDEFTQALGIIMYSGTVRDAEATMPGAYDLLPSTAYFSHDSIPVNTFDSVEPAKKFRDAIGAAVTSFTQLSNFLTDAFHLDAFSGLSGSTKTPIPLSAVLVEKAETTHTALDSWIPPENLDIISLAGWGQMTPQQESYTGKVGLNCERTSLLVPLACSLLPQLQPSEVGDLDGDDTVVSESALGDSTQKNYFNLKQYFSASGIQIDHASLLSSKPVQDFIWSILSSTTTVSKFISSTIPTTPTDPLLVISAHSPSNILAKDSAGNETGILPLGSLQGIYFQKKNIPGSSVEIIGEEKYLYLPKGVPYSVTVQGYDTGTTTVDVDLLDTSGTSTHLMEFPDIPTTATTTITFKILPDGTTVSDLPEPSGVNTPSSSIIPISNLISSVTNGSRSGSGSKTSKTSIASSTVRHTSYYQFSENTVLPKTSIREIIKAFITIVSIQDSWTMYATIFLSLLPHSSA